MSDNPNQPLPSTERVERSIIRRVGRTRYAQLITFIREGVDTSFLVEEFSLDSFEVHAIRMRVQENTAAKVLRTQTN